MGGYRKIQNRSIVSKEMAANQSDLENQLFKENLVRSETFRTGAFNALGMPGTYEEDYESFAAGQGIGAGPGGGVAAPTGMFSLVERTQESKLPVDALSRKGIGVYSKQELKDAKKWEKSGGLLGAPLDPDRTTSKASGWLLNPDAAMEELTRSRQFRMVSRMTAEADQLVRQEGPMWEQLKASVQNPILQGAAAANEEMTERLAREAARGGSARNRAVNVARQIQGQNDIMRDRTNSLWQSNLALKQWTQDNARTQLAFNQAWTSNLGGVRDTYNSFMQNAQQFYGSQIAPIVIEAAGQNQASSDRQMAVNAQLQQMQADRNSQMAGIVAGVGKAAMGAGLTYMANQQTQTTQPNSSNNYAVGGSL